uniref:Microfibril associated protein 5 n=1 Tax=Salvator merianae TaxID=96440 RepID=A0A8D0BAD2_SALMN
MMACEVQKLLCLIALAALPFDWLLPATIAQDVEDIDSLADPTDVVGVVDPAETVADEQGETGPTATSECREEQFPCTRLYSVHKPVKQCISYLCVTSVRRTYMINKEICSRIVCKEDEVMQDEICRQLAGLPPRRLRRSSHSQRHLCRRAQDQKQNAIDTQ